LGSAAKLDHDLETMSRRDLIGEFKRLRTGIREHRDSSGHDLCWHHPQLWGLMPEETDPLPVVRPWPEFLAGCLKYRRSLDAALPGRVCPVGAYQGEAAQAASLGKKSHHQRVGKTT
jgi:hypothetical protein